VLLQLQFNKVFLCLASRLGSVNKRQFANSIFGGVQRLKNITSSIQPYLFSWESNISLLQE
jgi:hypothetical protein